MYYYRKLVYTEEKWNGNDYFSQTVLSNPHIFATDGVNLFIFKRWREFISLNIKGKRYY